MITNRFALGGLTLLLSPVLVAQATPTSRPSLHSERQGDRVTVAGGGPTFRIPKDWLEWEEEFHDNFCLRPDAKALDPGRGEWDREYAEIVDAVFHLRECAFHGGGEGWGEDSVAFSDLQMRVYVLSAKPEAIEGQLDTKGAEALREVMSPARVGARNAAGIGRPWTEAQEKTARDEQGKLPPLEKFRPKRDAKAPWRRSVFEFELHYGDYGATAQVDVRLRRFGGRTVAMVFMYTYYKDQEAAIGAILKSVRWPNPPPESEGKSGGDGKKK